MDSSITIAAMVKTDGNMDGDNDKPLNNDSIDTVNSQVTDINNSITVMTDVDPEAVDNEGDVILDEPETKRVEQIINTDIHHNKIGKPTSKNYRKLYNTLVSKFQNVYDKSDVLFKQERELRYELSTYQKRTNSVLDMLQQLDSSSPTNALVDPEVDDLRLSQLIQLSPDLAATLGPLLSKSTTCSSSKKTLLSLIESISEIVQEESNPQNIQSWLKNEDPALFRELDVFSVKEPSSSLESVNGSNGISDVTDSITDQMEPVSTIGANGNGSVNQMLIANTLN